MPYRTLGFLLLLCGFSAQGQVRFSGGNTVLGKGVEGLLSVSLNSLYVAPTDGSISVTVTEESSGELVLSAEYPSFTLPPGLSSLGALRAQAQLQYSTQPLGAYLQANAAFPPGDYLVCYQFAPYSKRTPGDNRQCFYNRVFPKTPLLTISPADSICQTRPAFAWRGKVAGAAVQFKVVCVPVNKGQSTEEGLQQNLPVVDQTLRSGQQQLPFPATGGALKEGQRYAWQVQEVVGNRVVNLSEPQAFVVACSEKKEPPKASYAEVKPEYTGKKYFFDREILFAFRNPYAAKPLRYAIVHVASGRQPGNQPPVAMKTGLNQLSIPVSELAGLQKNQEYRLEIYNLASTTYYFHFIIKEQ